jgi:very-short-patch-repair endonuclease
MKSPLPLAGEVDSPIGERVRDFFSQGLPLATIGQTNPNAKRLRGEATNAEQRLWRYLRNRHLCGFKFLRQVTIGPFVADFACVECRVVVEADGGQHSDDIDQPRTACLERLGWQVLRFWNDEVLQQTDAVLGAILAACESRKEEVPSPSPLPQAGEEK